MVTQHRILGDMEGASPKIALFILHTRMNNRASLETTGNIPSANPSTTGPSDTIATNTNRLFSKPALITTSINIEGMSSSKEILLSDMCKKLDCDILLIQKTHRGPTRNRPKIEGMNLITERPHDQYGSAIFARPGLKFASAGLRHVNDIEILTVTTRNFSVTSVYKPPGANCEINYPSNHDPSLPQIVMGDFNCHSTAWGYAQTDMNGELLETWSDAHELALVHDPKQPSSFNSGRWKRGYNPDNIFVSRRIFPQCAKRTENPIPKTQHRPITCLTKGVITPQYVPFKRRFNFKKAKWEDFRRLIDERIRDIPATPDNYEHFVRVVKDASRKTIARGCRTEYVPGLTDDAIPLMKRYCELYIADPFSEQTISAGSQLLEAISNGRQKKWADMIGNLDMRLNSRKAWKVLKNLSDDPTAAPHTHTNVTANQVATQLLLNGKSRGRKPKLHIRRDRPNESNCLSTPFSVGELECAMRTLKPSRAAGLDDLRVEQIIQFSVSTKEWLINMMNICVERKQIPKIWRRAQVCAILKPGKEPTEAKHYRPISLLCHTFKLMERMILSRIQDKIDNALIREQAGFRPGKSCCGQVLNLTEHIERGYQEGKITGVAFVDLSAAYDTVNHNLLLIKLYQLTKDFELTSVVESFLRNRMFYVSLGGKKSKWRRQQNGLPQGGVLAPMLFNIYTNDQPIPASLRSFIYADDTAVAAQENTFEEVEAKLEAGLESMARYYDRNLLKPNPAKTQICAFHLKNHQAKRELNVSWQGETLEHCSHPKYLGVTLDRSLTYKQHCEATKKKVCARNNILQKLTGSTWGARPPTLRTSALGLCISTAEYAAPVWNTSAHTKEVDVAVNEAARIVSGCLKPTPIHKLYPIIGIAPPITRRSLLEDAERAKAENDPRHPLYGQLAGHNRLRSRKSFLGRTTTMDGTPEEASGSMKKEIAPGAQLPYPIWRSLNRLRTGVTRCRVNLLKWGLAEDPTCDCGQPQNDSHLLTCPRLDEAVTHADLNEANDKAIQATIFWSNVS